MTDDREHRAGIAALILLITIMTSLLLFLVSIGALASGGALLPSPVTEASLAAFIASSVLYFVDVIFLRRLNKEGLGRLWIVFYIVAVSIPVALYLMSFLNPGGYAPPD